MAALRSTPRIAELILGAVTVALLLDALRRYAATSAIALVPTLSSAPVALLVLLPFLLQVPAVAILARGSSRTAAVASFTVLVVTAGAARFATETAPAIALSGIACLAGATLLSMLCSSGPRDAPSCVAEGLALGLVLDLVLRTLRETLDPAEMPPAVGALELIALIAVGAFALRAERAWDASTMRQRALLALPLVIAVCELAALNGWAAAAASGLGLADDSGLRATAVGTLAVALGLALGSSIAGRTAPALAAGSLVAGAAILALRVPTVSLAGAGLLASGVVLSLRALAAPISALAASPVRLAAVMAAGWLAHFAVVLAYWVLYSFTPALWTAIALLGVATVAFGARPRTSAVLRSSSVLAIVVAVAAALAAGSASPSSAPSALRLMTYNLHFGFDVQQTPSLDRIADTIAAASPDVVVLQEVMRGGSLAVQHDALGWLAGRLGMRYAFSPTIGDFFGNAVLTRLPIAEVERMSFARPSALRHSPRGALLVRTAGVTIVVTHLDEYDDADGDAVRQDEVRALLERWGGRGAPLLLAGDFNAVPESRPIAMISAAGFRDLAASSGPTIPSDDPNRRIDYVFGIGVTASGASVPASTASDHRPVVVDLAVAPR